MRLLLGSQAGWGMTSPRVLRRVSAFMGTTLRSTLASELVWGMPRVAMRDASDWGICPAFAPTTSTLSPTPTAANDHAPLRDGCAIAFRTRTAPKAAKHNIHTSGPQLSTRGSRSMGGENSTSWRASDPSATADQCTCARGKPAKEPPRISATATPSRLKANSQVMSCVRRRGLACLVAASRRGTASRDEAGHLVPALASRAGENHRHQAQQCESKPKLRRRQLQTNALPLCPKRLHRRTLLISSALTPAGTIRISRSSVGPVPFVPPERWKPHPLGMSAELL